MYMFVHAASHRPDHFQRMNMTLCMWQFPDSSIMRRVLQASCETGLQEVHLAFQYVPYPKYIEEFVNRSHAYKEQLKFPC